MDIAGAKALTERLGHHGRDDAPVASVEVSDDAPPVYPYLGVSEAPLERTVVGEGLPKWVSKRERCSSSRTLPTPESAEKRSISERA